MDHLDSRPSRPVPGMPHIPLPGEAERLAEFQRVEKVRAEIMAASGKYQESGVSITMIKSGMKLLCDFQTALAAIVRGDAKLEKPETKKI
jgi:hypothetical protein